MRAHSTGMFTVSIDRNDSKLAPSQWETSLQNNAVSHWLGTNLESALIEHAKQLSVNNPDVFLCFYFVPYLLARLTQSSVTRHSVVLLVSACVELYKYTLSQMQHGST